MRDLRELSKLPDSPGYWVDLEARMREGALGIQRSWWSPFAARAGILGGVAAAAGLAALLIVPPRNRGEAANPAVLFQLPEDPTVAAFVTAPRPPSLAAVMASLSRSSP